MKAILVIDMPNSCDECEYCGFYQDDVDERVCLLMETHFIGKLTEGERDVECPLRPLPEIKYISLSDTHDDLIFQMGWNGCLDEIMGETE